MKIAIFISTFPPKDIAGAEIAAYNTAKYLAKMGHDVHVITRYYTGLEKYEEKNGFKIHRVWFLNIPIIRFFTYIATALLEVLKLRPNIVHGYIISPGGLLSVISGKILKIPSVVAVQGSDIYLTSILLKKTNGSFVLRNADRVLALTQHMKNEIEKIVGTKNIKILPNGIEYERFKLDKSKVRKELGFKENEIIILYVGRLIQIKGVEYLIKAMKTVINKHPNCKLILVGDGDQRKKLKEIAKKLGILKYITFMGKIPNENIPKYMVASDIFVLPSLSEGFPVVLIEAMASGLPIIASNVRGIPEIVIHGENGLLAPPKNPKSIANNIIKLIENPKLRDKICKNNVHSAKEYDWDKITKKLDKVYKELLSTANF